MTRAARRPLAGAIAAVVVMLMIAGVRQSSAASLEATWRLYSRADVSSFAPGSAGSSTGYEIVSFAAAGPSEALETYRYAGPDLLPPMPSIVGCAASVATTTVELQMTNGYPYAGCVYLLGVSNTGANPIRVSLGSLDASAVVTCNAPGCSRADVDVVAGGRSSAEVAQLCSGPATLHQGLEYDIQPGDTFVCPVFVVVLQSARESANYRITVTPPPIDHTNPPEELATPTPTQPGGSSVPPSGGSSFPPPIAVAPAPPQPRLTTPTPVPTQTPADRVQGDRTPGSSGITPAAPSTGSGALVQRGGDAATKPVVTVAIGILALALVLWWPERSGAAASGRRKKPGGQR